MKLNFLFLAVACFGCASVAQAAFECSSNSQIPSIKLVGKTLKGISTLTLTLDNPNTGEMHGPANYIWTAGSSLHGKDPLTKYSGFFDGSPTQIAPLPEVLFLQWWGLGEVDEPQFLLYNTQDGDSKVTLLSCSHTLSL